MSDPVVPFDKKSTDKNGTAPGSVDTNSADTNSTDETVTTGIDHDRSHDQNHDQNQDQSHDNDRVRRKGVYLLPNLLTTGALFAGFYAILSAMDGNFSFAAIAIYVAMLFDGLDGRVARLTNTQSEFGVQYDSLSDMVSFGVAPAVLMFSWILESLGNFGWAAAFIYASCAALRLARFNVQVGSADERFFIGLASPAAAGLVAAMVWFAHGSEATIILAISAAVVTAAAGLLMVVNIRYHSAKAIDLKGRVPFVVILGVVMVLVVISIDPPRVLLSMAILYALSGPSLWVWTRIKGRQ
ncbi:MAG: CDP-diacylglycerol--serine O-phosphatidyltransferase [Porticoccaceae bacterium]|nr:CDP-diacylglycerol--serine O-phosphatidyltransferase [Porticoccaceae bacterium]